MGDEPVPCLRALSNDNFGVNPNDILRSAGGVVTDLKSG